MKKKFFAVALAATMTFGILAGCGNRGGNNGNDDGNNNDNDGNYTPPTQTEENVPLVSAIDGMDGVYSPFFATAAYDSEISGQTQLGMLTTSTYKDPQSGNTVANYAYGDDYACVVKDLNITYLDAQNKPTVSTSSSLAYTKYDFLIKKGIKFSDGEDLTIDDVLFNLYVYLDPSYTGSSTIYSTDIVGLDDYKTQGNSGSSDDLNDLASTKANERLQRVSDWCIDRYIDTVLNGVPNTQYQYSGMTEEQSETAEKDAAYFLSLYDKELSSAYDSTESSFNEIRKTYKFDANEYWEYFLFQYGLLFYNTKGENDPRAAKEFVKLTDPENGDYEPAPEGTEEEDISNNIYEVYVFDFVNNDQNRQMKEEVAGMSAAEKREWAIDQVYTSTVGGSKMVEGSQVVPDDIDFSAFATTVVSSSTTTDLYNYILSDEISNLVTFAGNDISGITTDKVTKFTNEKGKTYDLDGTYDVLSIKINGVDPKAIWNFAFTVAPQHYYAPTEEVQQYANDEHPIINGVVFNSSNFMNLVLQKNERQRVPVGAGPYMASRDGGLQENQKYPTPGQFESNGFVYYERNPYFDLVDGVKDGGAIRNARIKYFRYKKINSSFMLQSLETKEIDIGMPNCTTDNINELNTISFLSFSKTRTNGYGYVGINAGHEEVSNVWVRRAIMKAINVNLVNSYFGEGNSAPIYRPMSLESWAYPPNTQGGNAPYVGESLYGDSLDYSYDDSGQEILNMLQENGFKVSGGRVTADPDGKALQRITFTVAGESTDHPAYQAFQRAKEILEGIGFDIAVETNANALTELNRGGLTVWAAAWSSTVDPDMYQVYHINSLAGSTVNWGYNEIKQDTTKYAYEYDVIKALSEQIDLGRQYLDQATRRQFYWTALDYVMELAVEFPLYQRYDLTVYNSDKINSKTLVQAPNAYENLFSKIWEVGYNN